MWLGPKSELNLNKAPLAPVKALPAASTESPVDAQPEAVKAVIQPIIQEVRVEVPVELIKEVVREVRVEVPVEVIREITREVIVEVPVEVIKEVVREVRVEVPVEIERIIKIPVIQQVKHIPAWVRLMFWFELIKYAGIAIWLVTK